MYEPQRAQRLDQIQLGRIEVVELAVSFHHRAELHLHRCAVTRKPHPDILHGRTHARIVEIDEMRSVVGPEDIAAVAVTVEPDRAYGACSLVSALNAPQHVFDDAGVSCAQLCRHITVLGNVAIRYSAEIRNVDAGTVFERAYCTDGMNPGDETPEPAQDFRIFELGCAAGPSRIQRKAKSAMLEQRYAIYR